MRLNLIVPISVLPIFADLDRIRTAETSPILAARFSNFKTKLLVVARLESEKNIALAIRAFQEATPLESCLIVVGNGRERKVLQHLVERLSISERVFFEGEQDAALYYPLAALVLVPSKYEGYGLVIIEALAAGKPVLSTEVGIAREAGAIVADPEHFAGALDDWFKNGPREGVLKNYPYKNLEEYVKAYRDDLAACIESQKKE